MNEALSKAKEALEALDAVGALSEYIGGERRYRAAQKKAREALSALSHLEQEPIGYITSDDLADLKKNGVSTIYGQKQDRQFGQRWEHCALYAHPCASGKDAWQPIETAPKDGSRILIGCTESELHCAESAVGWWQEAIEDGVDYMGADAGFVDVDFQVFSPGRSFGNPMCQYAPTQPTHWMPLPAAPDAALAQKGGV